MDKIFNIPNFKLPIIILYTKNTTGKVPTICNRPKLVRNKLPK